MTEKTDTRAIPVYKESPTYAREHNELEAYRSSNAANIACKQAIEQAITEKWDGANLPNDCVSPILEAFGIERVSFVLANTLQLKQYDGRFSRENMSWAQNIQIDSDPNAAPTDRRFAWEISSHPLKLDLFVRQARKEIDEIGIAEIPLYQETFAYASQHMEENLYWDSYRCNIECAKEIREAVDNHYDGFRLQSHAADDVLRKYGKDRTFYVLASTIDFMRDDGRVSLESIRWADTFPLHKNDPAEVNNRRHFSVRGQHPGLFDLFVKTTRREQEKAKLPTLSEQLKKVKSSVQSSAMPDKKKHEAAL